MTPHEFLIIRNQQLEIIANAKKAIIAARLDVVDNFFCEDKLKLATMDDIKPGIIVYIKYTDLPYSEENPFYTWHEVGNKIYHSSYTIIDGSICEFDNFTYIEK